ncbi:MAG TPA: efflux RND transporter permease subunit [Chloroflexia bacterium]|nr:efflux RND transporter permease subunit [Chloroflexia bacterium]
MHVLTRAALNRVAVVLLLAAFVVVGGVFSATQLKSELLPNIDIPTVTVFTVYPGAAPDDVLRDVTQPIERAVAGTASLKSTNSTSNDNISIVSLTYEYGTDMEKTQQSVEDLVNRVTLPTQVQRPTVGRFNFGDIPMVVYTLNTNESGADALSNLRRKATDVVLPEIQAIPGVNSASISGGSNKQILITLDEKKLAAKGLTAAQITGILQANNISFPTGTVVDNGQSIPVVVSHEFTSLDDLRKLVVGIEMPAGTGAPSGLGGAPAGAGGPGGAPVGAAGTGGAPSGSTGGAAPAGSAGAAGTGSGATAGTAGAPAGGPPAADPTPVALQDVATVDLGNVAATSISRTNGKPSLALVVYKTQNANTVQASHAVDAKLQELKAQLGGSDIVPVFNQADFIEDSLNSLIREGISGAILAILVILLFLRSVRSTLVTAISIPLSILIAFILFNNFNLSLNIMSLAGMAVAVGRVVDDSIVVLENIFRHVHEGEPVRKAAYNGTREVATAITSSTLTTVSVFLPLGFLAGFTSEVFRPFAVAVTLALLASLLVALTVVPVFAALFIRPDRKAQAAGTTPRDTGIQRTYTPALTLALRNRWTKLATLALAALLFAGSLTPLALGAIGTTFLSFGSDKVLTTSIKLAPGTDIGTTSATAAAVEAKLATDPMVSSYQTTMGANTDASTAGFSGAGSNNVASITVNLKKEANVDQEAEALRTLLKSMEPKVTEFTVTTGSSGGGPNSSAFAVVVTGPRPEDIKGVSNDLVTRLKTVPGLVNVTSDLAEQKAEISVAVDPDKALQHGSSAVQIAGQIRGLLTSQKVTQVTVEDQAYDVMVGYDPATLNSIDRIREIKVGAVNPVALSEVATVEPAQGAVSITRVDQQLAVTINGTITDKSTSGVLAKTQQIIAELPRPAGVEISNGGVAQLQTESFGQLFTALAIAIGLVYVVMVLFFGSLSTPFVIMFSLPLAFIGSFLALWITGRPFGISAMIGLLMLVGIVVTNAIVLLDMVEQHKRLGHSTYDSLIHGGRVRVRPIMMTAIATIIALIPLGISDEGSIIAAELGTVVIGGLFTSTLLTLIVVPVVYSILDSIRARLTRGRPQSPEDLPADDQPTTAVDDQVREREPELVTV